MRRWLAAGALALAPALGTSNAQDAQAPPPQADPKPLEAPFYEKYLVFGNPLDDDIRAMEKKIAAQPGDANLHNDLGNLLALRGFPEQAAEQYEQAAELDKSNFIALYNLGLLRETEGKWSNAISAYKKSIKRKPGFPPSRFRLGRLLEQNGKLDDAVAQYARAFWIDPSMRDPKRNPLVVDSTLMYRASLAIYERDLARTTLDSDLTFRETPAFRQVPVDRSVNAAELTETEPEPAPREIGPGSGIPAGPATVRRPASDAPRQRAPGSRPPRTARPAPAPAPPSEAVPESEPAEMTPPEMVPPENVEPPPEGEPTPPSPEQEVEPS